MVISSRPSISVCCTLARPVIGPAPRISLRRRPFACATSARSRGTSRRSRRARRRSRRTAPPSRVRCAAWSSRPRNDGHGPADRRPGRTHPAAAHGDQQRLDDLTVRRLTAGPDEIRLADPPALEHQQHGRAMVVDVQPVAHVQPVAVELGAYAVEHVRDLARDELLDVLPGPVVVRAVRHGRLEPERAHPGRHEQVGAGLRRRVRARRAVGRGLVESAAGRRARDHRRPRRSRCGGSACRAGAPLRAT